jgi:hypothetical protein
MERGRVFYEGVDFIMVCFLGMGNVSSSEYAVGDVIGNYEIGNVVGRGICTLAIFNLLLPLCFLLF